MVPSCMCLEGCIMGALHSDCFQLQRRHGMRTHLQMCIGGSGSREAKRKQQQSHMDPQIAGN